MRQIELKGQWKLEVENLMLREEILQRDMTDIANRKNAVMDKIQTAYRINPNEEEWFIRDFILHVRDKVKNVEEETKV